MFIVRHMLFSLAATSFQAATVEEVPTSAQLLNHYAQNKVPFVSTELTPFPEVTVEGYRCWKISFVNRNGDAVSGVFVRPKGGDTVPRPCAILMHGLTDNHMKMARLFVQQLVEKGVSVLSLDAPHHGRRASDAAASLIAEMQISGALSSGGAGLLAGILRGDDHNSYEGLLLPIIENGVGDYQEVMEWLVRREDVNSKRIGVIGYSMGGIMATLLAGIDGRIRAMALCLSGDPVISEFAVARGPRRERIGWVTPSFFAMNFGSRPLLMINSETDGIMPKVAAETLLNAATGPKELRWMVAPHTPLAKEVADAAAEWMIGKLKG